jgi:hypothetical protein
MTDYLEITSAQYVDGYRIAIRFNDGTEQVVDFEPFLRQSNHPDISAYRRKNKFKDFHVSYGNLLWGDYEMVFPLADLHQGKID